VSQKFKVGDHVFLEMSNGKSYRCVVSEYEYPRMLLKLDDETVSELEDIENGDEVKIELEAVN
jgi:hypothetical protein